MMWRSLQQKHGHGCDLGGSRFPRENCFTEVEHMRFSQEPREAGLFLVLGTVLFQAVETGHSRSSWTSTAWIA